jgi:DNA-binding NarL/FixJ family response regulator
MKKLRILIADDHDLLRRGVQALIEREPGWKVCGSVANGTLAISEARRLSPDIAVVDLSMPDMDGLEVTRRIKRHLPKCEVLIFTGSNESDQLIRDVFECGANSYILKSDVGQHLIDALRSLSENKPYFTEQTSAIMFARFAQTRNRPGKDKTASDERLTPDELKLVRLLADGDSNAAVAKKQRVSVRTVENLRAGIMHKLTLTSFADLVRYAARNGIIKA